MTQAATTTLPTTKDTIIMKNPGIVQRNEHTIFQTSVNGNTIDDGTNDVNKHQNGPLHVTNNNETREIISSSEHLQHQQTQKELAEDKTVPSPPTVTATETSCTTAFPSLPPCHDQRGGLQQAQNIRPTRDRVLRTLSNALMRKSLTMVSLQMFSFFNIMILHVHANIVLTNRGRIGFSLSLYI